MDNRLDVVSQLIEDGGFQVSTDGGETVYLYQPRIYGEE
jgi:hypothetical protein